MSIPVAHFLPLLLSQFTGKSCSPGRQVLRLTFLEMAKAGVSSGPLSLLEFWILLFQTGARSVFLCRVTEWLGEKESHFQDGEEADRIDW